MPLAFAPSSLSLELPVLGGINGRGSLARDLCQSPDELPTATLGLVPRPAVRTWHQQFLGAIPEDPELQRAVRTAGRLLQVRADAPSAAAIHQAAMRLELTVPAAA